MRKRAFGIPKETFMKELCQKVGFPFPLCVFVAESASSHTYSPGTEPDPQPNSESHSSTRQGEVRQWAEEEGVEEKTK